MPICALNDCLCCLAAAAPKPTQLLLAYWGTYSEDGSAEGMKSEKMSRSFGSGKHDAIAYFTYNSAEF
jgi:hypothetical protein